MSNYHIISGNCVMCGTYRQSLQKDHIIPKCKGGTNDPSNIKLLCANCHEDKTKIDVKGIVDNSNPSQETRDKLSANAKRQWSTEEARIKVSASQKKRWSLITQSERTQRADKGHVTRRKNDRIRHQ
jgi:5-methylcytosine-specific restriction endonuclease McrA